MKKNYADYLLKKTKDDYNRIAPVFSSKRTYLESDWSTLIKYAKEGSHILDLGCGNGRLSELFAMEDYYLGVDISKELIKLAQKRYPGREFQTINFPELSFLAQTFNIVYCLAVFHHIPSQPYRLTFLKEIRRILKPKGRLILTVWYFWSKWRNRINLYLNYPVRRLGMSPLNYGDLFKDFKDSHGHILAKRYYHAFTITELTEILKEAGFVVDKISVNKRGRHENIIAICSKAND